MHVCARVLVLVNACVFMCVCVSVQGWPWVRTAGQGGPESPRVAPGRAGQPADRLWGGRVVMWPGGCRSGGRGTQVGAGRGAVPGCWPVVPQFGSQPPPGVSPELGCTQEEASSSEAPGAHWLCELQGAARPCGLSPNLPRWGPCLSLSQGTLLGPSPGPGPIPFGAGGCPHLSHPHLRPEQAPSLS